MKSEIAIVLSEKLATPIIPDSIFQQLIQKRDESVFSFLLFILPSSLLALNLVKRGKYHYFLCVHVQAKCVHVYVGCVHVCVFFGTKLKGFLVTQLQVLALLHRTIKHILSIQIENSLCAGESVLGIIWNSVSLTQKYKNIYKLYPYVH